MIRITQESNLDTYYMGLSHAGAKDRNIVKEMEEKLWHRVP